MSELTSLEKDELARKGIVSEIDKNFFVEAGAGSGKTTMLVSRIVAMVEAGIDISKICAITFTKNAANEFYERVQALLSKRSNPNTPWTEDDSKKTRLPAPDDVPGARELCEKALHDIDLCFMGTIDSFCNMILSEYPSEAGIPAGASVAEDEIESFLKQEYANIRNGLYDNECGESLSEFAEEFEALHWNAQDVFVAGIRLLLDKRNVHFNYNESFVADIDKDERDFKSAIQTLIKHPELKYSKQCDENDKAWADIKDSYERIREDWNSDVTSVINGVKNLKEIRLEVGSTDAFPHTLRPVFDDHESRGKPVWQSIYHGKTKTAPESGRYLDIKRKLDNCKYHPSMHFLSRCITTIESKMRAKGFLTYFFCLYYLREMLKRDIAENKGVLTKQISQRHRYYLIDEFQDTNPLQAEVFFYLASEAPVPNWRNNTPRPGSLFIVGDPKQSIYRFRGADVESFKTVKAQFNKEEVLELTCNFRSLMTLCDWFDSVMPGLLSGEDNSDTFIPVPCIDTPAPTPRELAGVYDYTSCSSSATKEGKEHPELVDSERIATIVGNLVGREKYGIRENRDSSELRNIRFSDFMVITSNKDKLEPIAKSLQEHGIPAKVEGVVRFSSNEALRVISNVFSSVVDQENGVAAYGVLRGKTAGFSNADLLRYRQSKGTIALSERNRAEQSNNSTYLDVRNHIINNLGTASSEVSALSPSALYLKILDCYQAYRSIATDEMEVVCYALELMRAAEASNLLVTLEDGSRFLRDLSEQNTDVERCLRLDAEENCVHLANLHKVKGLEAPIVILANATAKSHAPSSRVEQRDEEYEGYIFQVKPEGANYVFFETADFEEKKGEEAKAEESEEQRKLYVAATRARNALIICSSGKPTKWKPLLQSGSRDIFDYLGEVPETPEEPKETVSAAVLYEQAARESALNNRSAEAGTYKVEKPSGQPGKAAKPSDPSEETAFEAEDEAEERAEETVEIVPAAPSDKYYQLHRKPYADWFGTSVHKLMEMLVTSRNRIDPQAAIAEIIREFRKPETQGMEPLLAEALADVAQTMRAGGYAQNNSAPQDILGTLLAADEVHCELPFGFLDETGGAKTVWNGIMDVVYRVGDEWHIVDYKTNEPKDGIDLDEHYRDQLAAYMKAFAATTGQLAADALTYHIVV